MGLIDDELQEVEKLCQHVISGSRLVSCVRSMVRVEIRQTAFKNIIVLIQFPEDYPHSSLLLELKSKTLSDKLLDGLTNVCEQEAKKILGKPQVLLVLKFVRNFLEEHPLSCCYDEISEIKRHLTDFDEFKLKQKASSISLKILEGCYYFKSKVAVPDIYPETSIRAKVKQQPPFKPRPSLQPVVSFLVSAVKQLPHEKCQLCKQLCLPQDPQITSFLILFLLVTPNMLLTGFIPKASAFLASLPFTVNVPAAYVTMGSRVVDGGLKELQDGVTVGPRVSADYDITWFTAAKDPLFREAEKDESADRHVERVYCSHLFHLECLITFMKTPPFHGGKKCPTCGQRIYHDKWRLSEKITEDRWAHQQARERELKEVAEFLE
uniref:RWD domain-containing protein n=1 Tax=Timema genevievae TaxID=629358 RepID=A0A7R9JSG0_TIMGE|nr:unnamed protein product [Timema genevievae]